MENKTSTNVQPTPEQPIKTLDTMTKAEFNAMMEKGYMQAKLGIGLDLDEAFQTIGESILL